LILDRGLNDYLFNIDDVGEVSMYLIRIEILEELKRIYIYID